MSVHHKGTILNLEAIAEETLRVWASTRFELCSFHALSKRKLSADACVQSLLGYVVPECCTVAAGTAADDPLFSGPGACHPAIVPVLSEFRDVWCRKHLVACH
jgi:hypothetical protein